MYKSWGEISVNWTYLLKILGISWASQGLYIILKLSVNINIYGLYTSTIHIYDVCNIEPGDMGENVKETRNTVVFIGT